MDLWYAIKPWWIFPVQETKWVFRIKNYAKHGTFCTVTKGHGGANLTSTDPHIVFMKPQSFYRRQGLQVKPKECNQVSYELSTVFRSVTSMRSNATTEDLSPKNVLCFCVIFWQPAETLVHQLIKRTGIFLYASTRSHLYMRAPTPQSITE